MGDGERSRIRATRRVEDPLHGQGICLMNTRTVPQRHGTVRKVEWSYMSQGMSRGAGGKLETAKQREGEASLITRIATDTPIITALTQILFAPNTSRYVIGQTAIS